MKKIAKYTYEQAYNKFKEKGYILLDLEYKNSKTKMNCIDNDGYRYFFNLETLTNYFKIEKFSKHNPYTIYNIKHYIGINNIKSNLISTEYVNTDSKLEFECPCNERFFVSLHHFIGAEQYCCKKCRRPTIMTKEDICNLFNNYGLAPIFEDLVRRPTKTTKIKCIDAEGYIGETTYVRAETYNGAFDIISKKNKYTLKNINTYFKNNNKRVRVNEFQDYKGSQSKMTFYCGECGAEFTSTWDSVKTNNIELCDCCRSKTSSLEYRTLKYLTDNYLYFIPQYRFEDCKNKRSLPFDFYLPNHNICIECNGKQHYEIIDYFGGIKRYKYQVTNDKIKEDYCCDNNIKLIKLSYESFDNNSYIDILNNSITQI